MKFIDQFSTSLSQTNCRSLTILLVTMFITTFLSILLFLIINSTFSPFAYADDDEPTVKLSNGAVIGSQVNIFNKSLYIYLGIPYAKNQTRFKQPELDDRVWNENLIAKKYGPGCPQPEKYVKFQNFAHTGHIKYDENCLFLNIWTPVLFNRTNPSNKNQLKPVFIFIHGGALLFNSASEEKYFDGQVLASLGDIVVVTLNYRLGILGFLYDGKEIKGNLGLLDQRIAFEWVAKNIEKFGGDPNKITIAGESAGSWSVGIHLLLEKKENENSLFHNAIMMSGSPLAPVLEEPEEIALKKFELVQKKTKCKDLECLQSRSIKELMDLSIDEEIINLGRNTYRLAFQPVYGSNNGLLTKSTLDQLLDNGHQIKNRNLLIGNLANEGIDAWTLWKMSFKDLKLKEPKKSREEYIDALNTFMNTTIGTIERKELNSLLANIDQFYFNHETLDKLKDDEEEIDSFEFNLQNSFFEILSDLVFICPAKFYAENYFRKITSSNVYEYQITYESMSVGSKQFAPWCEQNKFGPCHMIDLQYLFGRPFKFISKYSQTDRAMSFDLIRTIANFVRTGKTVWKPYFKMQIKQEELIVPAELEFDPHTGNEELIGFRYLSCEMFSKYFYETKQVK